MDLLLGLDWTTIGTLAAVVFLASFVANLIAFGSRLANALITAVLFVIIYIAWIHFLQALVFGYFGYV